MKKVWFLVASATVLMQGVLAQPNMQNVSGQAVTTQVNAAGNEALKWITWALWIICLLAVVWAAFAYMGDKPEKKTALTSLGIVFLLASIATVIFGL